MRKAMNHALYSYAVPSFAIKHVFFEGTILETVQKGIAFVST